MSLRTKCTRKSVNSLGLNIDTILTRFQCIFVLKERYWTAIKMSYLAYTCNFYKQSTTLNSC